MRDDVQADVLAELNWDPNVDSADIAVDVTGGAVSLRGTVSSVRHMRHALGAARRVRGVTSVRNYLSVRRKTSERGQDAKTLTGVRQALMLNVMIPATIHADVASGVVHLTGKATWHCQRQEAELVCMAVPGVRGVAEDIALVPAPADADMQQSVISAYRRSASLARELLSVDAPLSGVVILSGTVTSWAQREEAVAAAWSVPGVTRVDDRILLAA